MTRAARAGAGLALALLLAMGVAIALAGSAVDDGYLVPTLARAWSSWIPGPLADLGLGVPAPLGAFFAEAAAMTVAYAAVVLLAPRVRLRWIAAAVLVLTVALTLAPPLLSTDVLNYVDVGRLAAHYHLDPYVVAPSAEKHDPLYALLHWRHVVTVYGPVFTLLAKALGGFSDGTQVWIYKGLAAASSLGCAALIGWIAQRRGRSPGRAVAAFGLNPLVLVWTVGGAHNDLLMLVALLGGVALVLAARPVLGGALAAGAAAVKLSGGLALPFLILGAGRGQRLRTGIGVAGGALAMAALAAVAFPDHALGMFGQLQVQQKLIGASSVPIDAAYALHLPTVGPTELHALHVVLALWLVGCVVAVVRGADPLAVIGWAFLGVLVTSTWILPWYLIWPLAFAAASGDGRLLIASCALGASYVIGHVPVY